MVVKSGVRDGLVAGGVQQGTASLALMSSMSYFLIYHGQRVEVHTMMKCDLQALAQHVPVPDLPHVTCDTCHALHRCICGHG